MSLRVFESPEGASRAVASAFVESARRAVDARGRFVVALSGGGTPRRIHEVLAAEHGDEAFWRHTHVFWSDERYVPPDDPESNVRMAQETLLRSVPIPSENVHAPETSLPRAEEAAERYQRLLEDVFAPEPPRIDWLFLGLGEDGHVASIFPGSDLLLDSGGRLVAAVRTSAKPPPVRLTMTLPLINRAREIHVVVLGESKREVLRRVLAPATELPAHHLSPSSGSLTWWTDRAACPR